MPTRGSLDIVREGLIAGWVMHPDKPDLPLRILIRFGQADIAELWADMYREDVAAAGIGHGRYGFAFDGPSAALPSAGCLVSIVDQATGEVVLRGSAPPSVGVGPRPKPQTVLSAPLPQATAETGRAAPVGPRVIQGFVDILTFQQLKGWVWCPAQPHETMTIRVSADGKVLARVIANSHRPDVEKAGYGTGRYGFDLTSDFHPPFGSCLITVEDDATGTALGNSPARLEAPLDLDGPTMTTMTGLFESPGSDDDLRMRADYAARQADRLIQRLSDSRSQDTARKAQRERRWRWRPRDGPEPPHVPMRAMVIDNTMPCQDRDAGSHAILSHMASLRRLGFDILFVPADMRSGPRSCGGRGRHSTSCISTATNPPPAT